MRGVSFSMKCPRKCFWGRHTSVQHTLASVRRLIPGVSQDDEEEESLLVHGF